MLIHISLSFHSYAESMTVYMEEEETRYLLPLKEYIAYCDALRLEFDHHFLSLHDNIMSPLINTLIDRLCEDMR